MKEYKDAMNIHPDIVAHIGRGTIIQHGKHNDRIYLMKFALDDTDVIIDLLMELAEKHKYSKVFCKVPKKIAPLFLANGYILEGYIPKFYRGNEDAFFVSKYLKSSRAFVSSKEPLWAFHRLLTNYPKETDVSALKGNDYSTRKLEETDVTQIANLYSEIFESYPFPIYDPSYIAETMREHVQYFGVFKEGELAALASSEIDFEAKNAEMTDFATHKAHAGNHLSSLLLNMMEQEMKKQHIKTLYTIARLNSIPMNKTFLRAGYIYSGTLINNTNISGEIESMNLYSKQI